MTLLGRSQYLQCEVTVLILVFLGLNSPEEGFKQELWLYTEDGNALYFDTPTPDLTKYSSILPDVKSYCSSGAWFTSSAVNYGAHIDTLGLFWSDNKWCDTNPRNFNATNIKSLRHWGSNETFQNALSLYSGKQWDGEEIFVTARAYTGISTQIGSLAATGSGYWTLYEGQNLDGRSVCLFATRSYTASGITSTGIQ